MFYTKKERAKKNPTNKHEKRHLGKAKKKEKGTVKKTSTTTTTTKEI